MTGEETAKQSAEDGSLGDRTFRFPVKWAVILAVAVVVSIVLWNVVFPWVMTLLPENF